MIVICFYLTMAIFQVKFMNKIIFCFYLFSLRVWLFRRQFCGCGFRRNFVTHFLTTSASFFHWYAAYKIKYFDIYLTTEETYFCDTTTATQKRLVNAAASHTCHHQSTILRDCC